MPRTGLARAITAAVIVLTALVAVGLTAPADGPFSIAVQPVFIRLGLDVDIKIGSIHLHAGWSAIPSSTNAPGETL